MNFVNQNMHKLGDEKEEHMTIGFEIVFPTLIELARKLEIKVLDDSIVLKEIYNRRDAKLAKSVLSLLVIRYPNPKYKHMNNFKLTLVL